jgi:hypothetical protein
LINNYSSFASIGNRFFGPQSVVARPFPSLLSAVATRSLLWLDNRWARKWRRDRGRLAHSIFAEGAEFAIGAFVDRSRTPPSTLPHAMICTDLTAAHYPIR